MLAVMAPNAPEYAVVFHAAAMAGGVVTTINPTYTDPSCTISCGTPMLGSWLPSRG